MAPHNGGKSRRPIVYQQDLDAAAQRVKELVSRLYEEELDRGLDRDAAWKRTVGRVRGLVGVDQWRHYRAQAASESRANRSRRANARRAEAAERSVDLDLLPPFAGESVHVDEVLAYRDNVREILAAYSAAQLALRRLAGLSDDERENAIATQPDFAERVEEIATAIKDVKTMLRLATEDERTAALLSEDERIAELLTSSARSAPQR